MADSEKPDNAKLTIRNAYPQDAPAIAAMLTALCLYESTPTPFDAIDYTRNIKALIEKNDANYFFLMAEYGEKPVGFVSYYFGYDLTSLAQGAHVGDLFIRDEFRGDGIGTQLLGKVSERVLRQSGQWISLTALRTNEKANAFYTNLNGVPVPVQFYAWGQQGLEHIMKSATEIAQKQEK